MLEVGRQQKNQPLNGNVHCYGIYIPILNVKLHLKKLPKVKDLSAEYAEILAEKKKLYGEYRQVKKDMQEIQRVRYDIDQFLKDDEVQKKERVRKHNITR